MGRYDDFGGIARYQNISMSTLNGLDNKAPLGL